MENTPNLGGIVIVEKEDPDAPQTITEDKLASFVAYFLKLAGGKIIVPLAELNTILHSDYDIDAVSDEEFVTFSFTQL